MDAVENVESMEIILLQASPTASTYRLDNFAVTTAIPEPGPLCPDVDWDWGDHDAA